jgi:NADH-quinone oxidoreductase subunit H
MGLSLVGVFLVFGTLRLTDMVVAQDTTLPLAGIAARLGWTVPGWASGFPFTVPAWGIVLQPIGFVLFLVCALASTGRPPFDVATGPIELGGGLHSGRSGLQLGWIAVTDRIRVVVTAGLLTTVFLGGGAVPWLPGTTIVGAIAPLLGDGFATLVCMVVHVVVFVSKLVVMIALQELVRGTLPSPRTDQLMDLCWRVIAPLAIANALVTALAMLLLEEAV